MSTSYDHEQREWCTFRPWRDAGPAGRVQGGECGRPATFTEYADQGRYELPRCAQHYDPPGRGAFKGPEDA